MQTSNKQTQNKTSANKELLRSPKEKRETSLKSKYLHYLGKVQEIGVPDPLVIRLKEMCQRLQFMEEAGENYTLQDQLKHYLRWIVNLPWQVATKDTYDLEKAQQILDREHYGLEEVKNRILEFIAVQRLTKDPSSAPVLCFLGPPGTGKTTLSICIAKALGRRFVRISMAAVGDVAQIKGTPHSQLNSEPGQIIKAMRKAKTVNPVILLDEVDKVSGGLEGGSMMASFLEILDPSQNHEFLDYYLDYPYDLSQVLFLATANKLTTSGGPVVDRMELTVLPDYTLKDKIHISQKFIWPKIKAKNGLTAENNIQVQIAPVLWPKIIEAFRFEPGLRSLTQAFNKIAQKIARQAVQNNQSQFLINEDNIRKYILI